MAQPGTDKNSERQGSAVNQIQSFFNKLWKQLKALNSATIIYILLALGLVLLLVAPPTGQALIGVITGYLFSDEIIARARSIKNTIEHEEVTRGVVLGVLIMTFLLIAPALIFGAALGTAYTRYIGNRWFSK